MSLTYGFYNSVAGDRRYNAEQMSSLFDGIIKDGIFASIGEALAVSASSGMNITVGTGKAWFKHTWTNNDAPLVLTVDPAEVVLKRIDAVVLEINKNDNTRANSIKIIKGTPSSVPVEPTLVYSDLVSQYPLAYINIDAGVSTIVAANITNMIGDTSCPFVTGVLETVNVAMLVSKWDGEFNDWFETIVNILDTNAAANLLNMINEDRTRLDVLDNGVKTSPTVTFGMNSKIPYNGESPAIPEVKMTGQSHINILGRDGNCEDTSKWSTFQISALVLDATNKIFGNNGFKFTIGNTTGAIYKPLSAYNVDITKYYLASAYVKNGNGTNIKLSKDATGGGVVVNGTAVTDTTKFTRVGILLKPSDMVLTNNLQVVLTGANAQYAYMDGVMINEITQAEYTVGDINALMAKYPYAESYACVINPYIQVIHDNLVRNGNGEEGIGWWTLGGSITFAASNNGGFNLTPTALGDKVLQRIKVKPFTDYYCNFSIGGWFNIDICHRKNGIYTQLLNGKTVGTFNSGDCGGEIEISFYCSGSIGGGTFDHVMLIEGTTAPAQYLPFRQERMVVETQLTGDDTITINNGEVLGLVNWKHKILYGKDYDWLFSGDAVGYKKLYLGLKPTAIGGNGAGNVCVKYDGKILGIDSAVASADKNYITSAGDVFYLSILDTDSGWGESINPNSDEIKAFMNGWKAIQNNGTRYIIWINIVDGSMPNGSLNTTTTTVGSNTVATVTSGTGTNFVNGDVCTIVRGGVAQTNLTVSSSAANTITFGAAFTWVSGDIIVKQDNGTTNISILNYCKNNIAPGYQGYQLHYKLVNPEPLTNVNARIEGDIPKFDIGDNYLFLDCGMVINEPTIPYLSGDTYWYINDRGDVSQFKYPTENISTIYKNGIPDNLKWTFQVNSSWANGVMRLYTVNANCDPNTAYSIDYKILATMAPSVGVVTCSYNQDVLTAISKLTEVAENKQTKDSILDNIVDLSIYEVIPTMHHRFRGIKFGGTSQVFMYFDIPISPKKVPPVMSINVTDAYAYTGSGGGSAAIPIANILVTLRYVKTHIQIDASYIGADTTTINNLVNNGGYLQFNLTLDCRGRV